MTNIKNNLNPSDTVSLNIPKIISKRIYFKQLLANRAVNFRKKLYQRINNSLEDFSSLEDLTLKNYFLYPERKIPAEKRNSTKYMKILEENLYITYLEQAEFINNSVEEIKNDYRYGTKEI